MFGRDKSQREPAPGLVAMRVRVNKRQVDEVFSTARSQDDYIWGLYELVIPGFAEARVVDGYPVCNPVTAAYIARKAEEFDRRNEPWRAPGMGWWNCRWDVDQGIGDWEVSLARVRVW
jgi:hypothetical protein